MFEALYFGKNTLFILACYGVSVAVLSGLIAMTLRRRIRAIKQVAKINAKPE